MSRLMSRLRELRPNWTPPFTGGKNYIHLVLKVRPRRMACLLPFKGYSWVRTFDNVTCPICRGRMFAEAIARYMLHTVKRALTDPEVWGLAIMAILLSYFLGGYAYHRAAARPRVGACTAKDCNDQPAPPPPRTPPPPPQDPWHAKRTQELAKRIGTVSNDGA